MAQTIHTGFPARALGRGGAPYEVSEPSLSASTSRPVLVVDLCNFAPVLDSPVSHREQTQTWINEQLAAAGFETLPIAGERLKAFPPLVDGIRVEKRGSKYAFFRSES